MTPAPEMVTPDDGHAIAHYFRSYYADLHNALPLSLIERFRALLDTSSAADFSPHGDDLFGDVIPGRHSADLAKAFLVPPFSVLSAREGWWQERKRAWLALGIQSELGRGQERLEMAHPATTATIDFYAQKRALEAERGGANDDGRSKSDHG